MYPRYNWLYDRINTPLNSTSFLENIDPQLRVSI